MQSFERHPATIVALALCACVAGMLLLSMGGLRGPQSQFATAAPTSAANAAAPSTLSSAPAAAAAAPAPPAPAPPAPAPAAVAPAPTAPLPEPPVVAPIQRIAGVPCSEPHRLAFVTRSTTVHASPNGRIIGELPARSKYMLQPTLAWVQRTTARGAWGLVTIPWANPVSSRGWVNLGMLSPGVTRTMVVADLSDRRLRVYRGCDEVLSVPTAVGRPGSPSPIGRFWVTDRIAVPAGQRDSFGAYAFGLSAVQPNLPAGWTGGDQMAVHGTGAPGSVGQAASAGCLRVDDESLRRLRPLLRVGTPVVITA